MAVMPTALEVNMKQNYDLETLLGDIRPGGCAQPYILGFSAQLRDAGYSFLTNKDYARSASHLGRWLSANSLELKDIQPHHVCGFGTHLCDCPGSTRPGRAPSRRYFMRVRRFVVYLQLLEVVPATPPADAPVLAAALVGFREWISRHRGLSDRTIDRYERMVSKMLPRLGVEPANYDAALVRRVVLNQVRGLSPAYAKTFLSALRAFLRFLATEERCRPHLDRAVPTIPQWTLSSLPRYLEPEAVERLIGSCDKGKLHGVRDRAILLLLARLGLRASDIVDMRLCDIDWPSGALVVRGKSRRETRLPLPQDAGDALLQYVVDARPDAETDRVFLCANAPIRPLAQSSTVSGIVRLALCRAGIDDAPSRGAHLLRHSAAVSMLRSGVTIDTISTILRHRSSDMTAYYAKVDTALLERVTQPWPEDGSC